jgi:hypothetical protein
LCASSARLGGQFGEQSTLTDPSLADYQHEARRSLLGAFQRG